MVKFSIIVVLVSLERVFWFLVASSIIGLRALRILHARHVIRVACILHVLHILCAHCVFHIFCVLVRRVLHFCCGLGLAEGS